MEDKIIETEYSDCMKKSYINYSMSVITSRAVPDARDGLKPVQRRTLYAMYELGLRHDRPHRKCARIVGDTMGKYHPHGDASVYDALVVMAQDFKRNEPLAEPHGNFGSIEGDDSAAMRYTEARLRKLTEEVYLADLDKDVVDFVPNFDETEQEPVVLPVRIPNLLVNGSEGIAVGMATNIPSHNLKECLDGMIALIDNPEITVAQLMDYIPGPDFATGGIVINQRDLRQIYETGVGKIKLRGKVVYEPGKKRGDKDRLVVTEIPYTMIGENIHRFLADVGNLVETRKLPEITDITNESSKEGIRIVLELKKDSDVEKIKNILYKKTKLEDTYGVNMLAIVEGRPEILSLKQALECSLKFQVEINTRKYSNMLARERDRLEIQEGLIRAVDVIDLIIEAIRGSKTQKAAKACLMGDPSQVRFKTDRSRREAGKLLHFTERQAQAILELRLSKLIGLEIMALEKEHRETIKNIARYEKILDSRTVMKNTIRKDLEDIRREYAKPRRTLIANAEGAKEVREEFVEQEVVFAMDRFGYAKTCEPASYEKAKETLAREYKYLFVCKNTDRIQLFTDAGRMHQFRVLDVPFLKWKDKGIPVDNLSKYDSRGEVILHVAPAMGTVDGRLLFVTRQGFVKQVEGTEFQTANKTVLSTKLGEGDRLAAVEPVRGSFLVMQTEEGYFLRFPMEEVHVYKKGTIGAKGIQIEAHDQVKRVWQAGSVAGWPVISYEGKELDFTKLKQGARGQKGTKVRKGK